VCKNKVDVEIPLELEDTIPVNPIIPNRKYILERLKKSILSKRKRFGVESIHPKKIARTDNLKNTDEIDKKSELLHVNPYKKSINRLPTQIKTLTEHKNEQKSAAYLKVCMNIKNITETKHLHVIIHFFSVC